MVVSFSPRMPRRHPASRIEGGSARVHLSRFSGRNRRAEVGDDSIDLDEQSGIVQPLSLERFGAGVAVACDG
jgi:hypothetical protein